MKFFKLGHSKTPDAAPQPDTDSGEFLMPTHAAPAGTTVVLLVEDEPALRMLYGSALRNLGYYVCEARNGLEALKAAEAAGRVDLVVTDLVMPFLSGAELAQRLREKHPDTPFIFVSAYMVDEMVGSNSHLLHKPFNGAVLLTKVREVIGPPATPKAVGA